MSRIEAQAIAGYYPTPAHLLPSIASLVALQAEDGRATFMDPCAGMGEAISTLVDFLLPQNRRGSARFYTCEMEATRAKALRDRLGGQWHLNGDCTLHGDAFRISFERGENDGVSVLYLNPPYDLDRVYGRLEHKFLVRFAPALMVGGALLFIVPVYALKASATFLAQEFKEVRCFRFPSPDFDAYKQVVLVAQKIDSLPRANEKLAAEILSWADNVDLLPVIPDIDKAGKPLLVAVPRNHYEGIEKWSLRPVDLTAIMSKVVPWHYTTRGGDLAPVSHVLPEVPLQDLMLRRYPVATPPRPAHIASGIASGIFNGSRIEAEDPSLPPLLVKGVFDKEYKTVEEKTNKEGDVTGVVQVQQPKLVVTALDLRTRTYHTLVSGTTGSKEVAEMGVGDLLQHYGPSLMRVMEEQCPILYDPRRPEDVFSLPSSPRALFQAQGHATRAIVKLLGGPEASKTSRRRKAAILLGEIGSGKSSVALMSAKTIDARRMLVMCPPHLLQSWTDEIAAVRPEAEVRVLQSVTDVDDLASTESDRPIIAILSRETAKLGHGWEGVSEFCPSCGAEVPPGDLAKKRVRCEAQHVTPGCTFAHWSMALARKVAFAKPSDMELPYLSRVENSHRKSLAEKKRKLAFKGVPAPLLDEIIDAVATRRLASSDEPVERALLWLCAIDPTTDRIARVVRRLAESPSPWSVTDTIRTLLFLLPPKSEAQYHLADEVRTKFSSAYPSPFQRFNDELRQLVDEGKGYARFAGYPIRFEGSKLFVEDEPMSALRAALAAVPALRRLSTFRRTKPCGEILFQAVPEPRRFALANYIAKRHRKLFDLLVLDECHEYASDGAAQERSAHRLTALGMPVILMSGSVMNGYAESLFTNMWAISPAFRAEFARDERSKFVDCYGYRKRLLQDKDEDGKVVAFGSHTDRVERSERVIGDAPGVLPLFLLRHLLPISVTLHKADLAIELPPCQQVQHKVTASDVLFQRYTKLRNALVAQIKKDQFSELAGRLMGALAELPSFLDRATADVGNVDDGRYVIRYPDSVGGDVVALQEPLPADTILPKEAWMLDRIESELAEGRNVLVFAWHVSLLPRLARLISKRIGEPVPVLHADKVTPAKRQAWINKEVVCKGRRVLVTNPVAIQTGLNNLVHFSTEIWMENPACNPIIFRQAMGRIDRIGQKKDTRVLVPVYENSMQIALYDLLMRKVAVSVSTDGLDNESALQAAGVGESEYITGLTIGRQLWVMLTGDLYSAVAA